MPSPVRIVKAILRQFVWETRLYRCLEYRRRFKGLFISDRADLQVDGSLTYANGGHIGEGTHVIVQASGQMHLDRGVFVGRQVEISTDDRLQVGECTSIQDFSVVLGRVDIGAHCLLAYGVMISSGRHYFRLRPEWLIHDQDELVRGSPELARAHHRAVVIEDDCWIGNHVVIMPAVTIGKGSVVGANAVVTKDLPPYCVAAGAPARVVGKRIEFLPPATIDSGDPRDLPYFYSGFSIRQVDLARNRAVGGIAARRTFSLALQCSPGSMLRVIVKSLVGEARLRLESHDCGISGEWTEIALPVPDGTIDRLRLEVLAPSAQDEVVAIKSARVA